MEFKELLVYAKRWWWFVALLTVGGAVAAFYAYPMLPIKEQSQRWGAAGNLELPSDGYRVITTESVTKRIVLDPNTEIADLQTSRNAATATRYYMVLEQKFEALSKAAKPADGDPMAPDAAAEAVLGTKDYEDYRTTLDNRGATAREDADEYFSLPGQPSLKTAKPGREKELLTQYRSIKLTREQEQASRIVNVRIENLRGPAEARLWIDAILLAAKRESHQRLIDQLDAFRDDKQRELDALRVPLADARKNELAAHVKGRLAYVALLAKQNRRVTASADNAEKEAVPAVPVDSTTGDPEFSVGAETQERIFYYSELLRQINERNPEVAARALSAPQPAYYSSSDSLGPSADRRIALDEKARLESQKALLAGQKTDLEAARVKLTTAKTEAELLAVAGIPETTEVTDSRRALADFQKERGVLLSTMTPAHYAVIVNQQNIDSGRDRLRNALDQAVATTLSNNAIESAKASRGITDAVARVATAEAELTAMRESEYTQGFLTTLYKSGHDSNNLAAGVVSSVRQAIARVTSQRAEQSAVLLVSNFSTAAEENRGAKATRLQVSLVVGLVMLIGSAVMIYVMMLARNKISTEYDVRRHINLPVLAKFARRDPGEVSLLNVNPKSGTAEAFSTLATQVRSYAKELSLRSLLITSAIKQEGKTDIASNLAISLSRKGLRVLLIDCDLHRPRVGNFFEHETENGLIQYLTAGGKGDIAPFVVTIPGGPDLLLPGGHVDEPVRMLESEPFKNLMKQAEREYDFVIYDSPPVARVGDALILASEIDATILVASSGDVTFADAALAKRLLTNVQANMLGVVLNNSRDAAAREYYNYYAYGDSSRRRVRRVFK
jgi:capsular exopolysaccharide synthesis family protein